MVSSKKQPHRVIKLPNSHNEKLLRATNTHQPIRTPDTISPEQLTLCFDVFLLNVVVTKQLPQFWLNTNMASLSLWLLAQRNNIPRISVNCSRFLIGWFTVSCIRNRLRDEARPHAIGLEVQLLPSRCRWGYRCVVLPWSSSCWSSGGLGGGRASRRGPGLCRPAGAAAWGRRTACEQRSTTTSRSSWTDSSIRIIKGKKVLPMTSLLYNTELLPSNRPDNTLNTHAQT